MALGSGTWTTQDKVLPGTYINFSSAAKASPALAARGIVAVPLSLSWGPADTVFTLDAQSIVADCPRVLGYSYYAPEMRAVRELFRNARTVLAYRLNTDAVAAANDYATAKYAGTRGNALKLVVSPGADGNGCDAANRIALLFNTQYIGRVPNDANGRISLWNDVCKIFQIYEQSRAIERFDTASVAVLPGEDKRAVVCKIAALSVVHAMDALYMDIVIQ